MHLGPGACSSVCAATRRDHVKQIHKGWTKRRAICQPHYTQRINPPFQNNDGGMLSITNTRDVKTQSSVPQFNRELSYLHPGSQFERDTLKTEDLERTLSCEFLLFYTVSPLPHIRVPSLNGTSLKIAVDIKNTASSVSFRHQIAWMQFTAYTFT